MKTLFAFAVVAFFPVCAHAQAAKPCEDLKTEITAKLDAKGVKGYSLDVVAKEQDAEGKVVGTCEGGTKKIVYRRGAAAPENPAKDAPKEPAKPQS